MKNTFMLQEFDLLDDFFWSTYCTGVAIGDLENERRQFVWGQIPS
jgi:hypothetical protein